MNKNPHRPTKPVPQMPPPKRQRPVVTKADIDAIAEFSGIPADKVGQIIRLGFLALKANTPPY